MKTKDDASKVLGVPRQRTWRERGAALMVSLFLLVVLAVLGIAAITTTSTDMRIGANSKGGAVAFYIAEAGIERAKAEIKGKRLDKVLAGVDENKSATSDNGIPTFGASVSYNGGTYAVQVTDNDDGDSDSWADTDQKVYITSTGTAGNGSRKVLKVLVKKAKLEDFNGAMSIVDDSFQLEFSGSASINGNDKTYNPDNQNNPDNGTESALHGIASDDSTPTYDWGNPNKPRDIQGSGTGTPDVVTGTSLTLTSLQDIRTELISQADVTYPGATALSGGTLGTRASPQITYVTGDLSLSGDVNGVGVLIVNERLLINGNFTWEGIILVGICSTCPGRFETGTGNQKIYGAIVVANPTSSYSSDALVKMTGNSNIYYSSYAIGLALKRTFRTISWQETS